MSGVKGENSIKLFGDDIDVLVAGSGRYRDVMTGFGYCRSRRVSGNRAAGAAGFHQPRRERAATG